MKNILFAAGLCVLLAPPIAAQTVTVSGSVTDAAGGQPVGTVTVAWPNFNYSGTIVQSGQTTKRPTAGSVSFTLYPGTYTVTYRLTNGNVTTVKWIVPASPSSTTIAAVQAAFLAPNTPTPIPIAQGGTGVSSLTASKCVQVNSDGDGLEASSDACGTSSIAASVQSGTSYTVVSGDKGKALFFTNASAVSVTIPAASAITGSVVLVSKGAGGVSASGGFTVTLLINEYVILISDGTTWRNVNQVLRAGSGSQSSTSGAVTSFNLDALLVAINALASNGFVARTSSSTAAARTITGTANEICVTNGDGVSGDPTSAICATFDISGKTSTKPMKTGTSAPGTCAVGEMFFDTNDTPGQNLYGCTSSNVWTLQSLVGTANEVSVSGGAIGLPSSIDISGKAIEMPNSTSLPGTCTVGQYYQDTDATSTAQLYLCTATNTWTAQGGAGSGSTAETYCVPTIVSGNLQVSTPCKVLVNNVELTFGSNMTCDASSGTGTILFGIQGTTAYCWHNVTLTATNATALGSTTAFPVDACALASATVTSGTVSDPVNIRMGRACPVVTSSSTATASADPSTGALQVDLVLSGTANEIVVSGGTVSLDDESKVPTCADAGSSDTYACTASPAPSAYVTGGRYAFKANTANTGAATVNFNSLGAKTIKKFTSASPGADLADNDIRAGQWVHLIYDGTNMQMVSALGNAGSGGSVSETLVTIQQDMCGKTDALGQFSMLRVAGYAGSEVASTAAETNGRAGCGTKLSTTTSSTSFYAYSLANNAHWLTMQSGRSPKLWMKWRAVDTSSTNVVARFQPAGATGAIATTESVGFVYSDATFGDSDIRFQVCVASSCTNTDTNVTMTAGVTYEGKVEQTGAAAWTWTIRSWTNEGSVTTTTGNVTSVNPPTEPIGPFALVLTGNTTAKSAVFHQFRAQYETN